MSEKENGDEIKRGVLKNLAGLFVIWLSLYLVAVAHDISSAASNRGSTGEKKGAEAVASPIAESMEGKP